MQVILFRHGIAVDAQEAADKGIKEHDRPLTRPGIARTAEAVEGLHALVKSVDLIAHSPLVRARQTADILAKAYPSARRVETRTLRPGTAAETLAQFVAQRASSGAPDTVILVGHEPDLSLWAAWATTGERRSLFSLKKAGACLIEFEGKPQAAAGRLLWLLPAGVLRKLS
jgi:phosphohistidine phosphatase